MTNQPCKNCQLRIVKGLTSVIIPSTLAATSLTASLILYKNKEKKHRSRLDGLKFNIHVNGIRGKSTVTRMIGGMLRGAGVPTIAKTTGTYACVITPDQCEHPIIRKGPANINEQYAFIKQWVTPEIQGLVSECMAVRPSYQYICQHTILKSPITIITNVRLDHQEEMGYELTDIARSLCATVPMAGTVITAERNPEILDVIQEVADERASKLIVAQETEESRALVSQYSYQQFEENIAVVLALIDFLGLDREPAIRGMLEAAPDPGTTTVDKVPFAGTTALYWVPMFAVNDWESTVRVFHAVTDQALPQGCRKILALNNRADRTDRAAMFIDLIVNDLDHNYDRIVLYGDIQDATYAKLIASGVAENIIQKTDDVPQDDGEALLRRAVTGYENDDVAVFGMINIHTEAVTAMRSHVQELTRHHVIERELVQEEV